MCLKFVFHCYCTKKPYSHIGIYIPNTDASSYVSQLISSFINCNLQALERRNLLQDAAARQQIQWTEDSYVHPITPVQAESTPRNEEAEAVATPATSLTDGKLKTSSPSDCYLQATSSKPNDSALADLMEKKLSRSIEQIEKIVSQLLKETPKATQPSKVAVQSMR